MSGPLAVDGALRRRLRHWRSAGIADSRVTHSPRRLTVPRSYLDARAPDPAPGFAIVTPSFSQARFVASTIDSVLAQGYPRLEYVVQDGGSTDGSVEVIRSRERELTRVESAPDGGQADAINRGFEGTTGELMGFLNSDDMLLPGALAFVATYLAAHPEVDVVYGYRKTVDERGSEIGAVCPPDHDDDVLALTAMIPQETMFWRRSLWERAGGGMDVAFHYALDWELTLRFRSAGAKFVRLPRFLGAFRQHADQKTSRLLPQGIAECGRLLEREHGRRPPDDEIGRRAAPYMRREAARRWLMIARERIPVHRAPVSNAAAGEPR